MSIKPDFEGTLSTQSSRKIIDAVVLSIADNSDYFKEVLDMAFTKPYPLDMRSAWTVQHVCAKRSWLFTPYIDEVADKLHTSMTTGVKRSFLKVYADFVDITKITDPGKLIDLCFIILEDPKETVACKMFSMEILYKSCSIYPELAPELESLLQFNMEETTSGYKNRAKRIISNLKKFKENV